MAWPQFAFNRDVVLLGVLAACFAAFTYGLLALVGTPAAERMGAAWAGVSGKAWSR
jgi:hypothetical protein